MPPWQAATSCISAGLPADAKLWAAQFPVLMENVIAACAEHGAKLVFFDNTYMYAMSSDPQTEQSSFKPVGSKAVTRARIATMLLDAMAAGRVEAAICRAPEFYGPGKTQSVTNTLVFDRVGAGKKARIPLRDDARRTMIWTPDASRGTALIGNTPSAFGQTWHLPCADDHPTYAQIMQLCSDTWGREIDYAVVSKQSFFAGRLVSKSVRESWGLLPRYAVDTVFVSDKFKEAFPGFETTSYRAGIAALRAEHDSQPADHREGA